ncbi:LysR family transcriptional regulator [Kitasatospora sp. MMS16-BH015]|uniref:LysR family transcriptional regulator n=1 Tax=Kitasatospora sp. MMS16-BH015 TaxID=2018025 RepID=UPI000CA0AE28|nr:LysR family transcriptional regulator [Kitasatospora sp. MMS16-BH015]AUG78429.1 LysR family transcriptional regulator [Kitasatospora sp. MMS16-BH015]
MEIKQLTTFHRAATVLSFTRAAAELKYAQSSVTAQIKGLELSLGVELFERLPGKIRLTPEGERLLPYADRILGLVDEARANTVGWAEPSGVLTIGTMESLTSYRMPPVLEFFHHRYPRLQLALRPSSCLETCEALRQGAFDMGFLMEAETRHQGVETEVLGPERLVAVAAPEHALVGAKGLATDDLRGTRILAPEAGCAYRELFEAELNGPERAPVPMLEFGNIESIKRGVSAGLGVSVLPAMAVADEVAARTLSVLDWTPPFEVFTQIAWRKGKQLTREMQTFIDWTVRFMDQDELDLAV